MKKHLALLVLVIVAVAFGPVGLAEDVYLYLPLAGLELKAASVPQGAVTNRYTNWRNGMAMQARVILEGEGEAYLGEANLNPGDTSPWGSTFDWVGNGHIAIRVPEEREITGQLYLPKPDWNGWDLRYFKVPAQKGTPEARTSYFQVKAGHYGRLLERGLPGAAWFRHQERLAREAGGGKATNRETALNPPPMMRASELEETYDLFTGGRALSENLQLDRQLWRTAAGADSIALADLPGLEVREMDWKPLVKDLRPAVDALATQIPADQFALFFPSFSAMTQMIDEADRNGTPVLHLLEPRSEDAGTGDRYQRQLCLTLNEVARSVGPYVVRSAAFTGSDPYLRTGTDVAVVFETAAPEILKTYMYTKFTAATVANPAIKSVSGILEGVSYRGVESPDRAICSFVAGVSNAVWISNSTNQIGSLAATRRGNRPALASQDEYRYFRNKYAQGDPAETAFLVLTDATLRRWCSPRWRIADSRRTRIAAVLAELQAANLAPLAKGQLKSGSVQSPVPLSWAGELTWTPAGVESSVYGSLAFLTPIAELPLTQVTTAEAEAYRRWRESYQQNWRQYFDPIAVRFSLQAQKMGAEVTVMPLIAGTEYRQFLELTRGAQILPQAGDPHPKTLLHLVLAINASSPPVAQAGSFLGNMAPGFKANPLGWLGQSLALYADADPFWEKLLQAPNTEEFMNQRFHELPLGLRFEVKNSLGLAAFLAGLRAYLEQTAPKMTVWSNAEYQGQAYVKITSADNLEGRSQALSKMAVYYAASPQSLLVTLNEPLLKRALDRQLAQVAAPGDNKVADGGPSPWLGANLCLKVERQFLEAFERLTSNDYLSTQQRLAWDNLPILNEWKRLFPDQDPVQFHLRFWQTRLVCPGGGTYRWNEQWQTFESTVYGHPGQPGKGSWQSSPLASLDSANFGLTFEHQGVSAKVVLARAKPAP